MKAVIPVIVKDPEFSEYKEIAPTENITLEEDAFLDGPVSPRVAILDFDGATGALAAGVPWIAPLGGDGKPGRYQLDRPIGFDRTIVAEVPVDRAAAAVSVFGAVHKTMRMFEEPDALGRKVVWAFGAPQLLVVPSAGEWANAYYERESHSLQFFHFAPEPGRTIFTSHSQDIVAHETAHALVDGVAPDLYSAVTPQSLAIHEAVADLAALLCSFRCRELTERVLQSTGGSIRSSSAFSGLAEQFAGALDEERSYLRDLNNEKSLRADAAPANRVSRSEPHALSEVLSGAFYKVLVEIHEELRREYAGKETADPDLVVEREAEYVQSQVRQSMPAERSRDKLAAAAKALFVAGERLKRTLLRGIDYLPPGDVTFADLARAVLASDRASHPESGRQRAALEREFVARGIVDSAARLHVKTNYSHPALRKLDLDALVESDYVAYEFARRNRKLLGIPRNVTFEVRPRLDVTKLYWRRDGEAQVRECLFKVSWTEIEPNPLGGGLPKKRRYRAGTTLAIEWSAQPRIRAVISTERRRADRADTTALLAALVEGEQLGLGDDALGPGGLPLRGVIAGEVSGGTLRVRGAGRMLHVTRER